VERSITNGRITGAVCVAIKRFKTDSRVAEAGCQAKKCIFALSGVLTRVASVGRWIYGPRQRAKPKAGQHKQCRCEYGFSIFHKFNFPFIKVLTKCGNQVPK
jgi:hypothetical protein